MSGALRHILALPDTPVIVGLEVTEAFNVKDSVAVGVAQVVLDWVIVTWIVAVVLVKLKSAKIVSTCVSASSARSGSNSPIVSCIQCIGSK